MIPSHTKTLAAFTQEFRLLHAYTSKQEISRKHISKQEIQENRNSKQESKEIYFKAENTEKQEFKIGKQGNTLQSRNYTLQSRKKRTRRLFCYLHLLVSGKCSFCFRDIEGTALT